MIHSSSPHPDIETAIAHQRPDHGFDQVLYTDAEIFSLERQRIFSGRWLYLDHASRVPNAGDFIVREFLGESIILIRSHDDDVRVFYNVCRHRGSRLCAKGKGHAKVLVCPYHGWSYALDGRLRSARHMPAGFDPSEYGLIECAVRVCHGLVFIRVGTVEREDFDEMMEPFQTLFGFYGLEDAKVAGHEVLPVSANWKLVIENNQECYHCQTGHPEFFETMSREYVLAYGAGPGSGPEDAVREFERRIEEFEQRASSLGHPTGNYVDPPNSPFFRAHSRVPFHRGYLSMTEDGKPAGPPMGRAKEFDGGRTAITIDPFTIIIGSIDYACIINMMPQTVSTTETTLTWLVDQQAQIGVNCDPDRIKWLLDVTIRQDGTLAEWNQEGVCSEAYRPGMYSLHEAAAVRFHEWYLANMQSHAPRLAMTS